MVLNATFNNISVISWQSDLLVKETGMPRENHRLLQVTDKLSNYYMVIIFNTINVFLPIYLDDDLYCLSSSIPSKLRLNHIQVVSWFFTSKSPLCISLSVTASY
jgi:hypothetical protein